MAYDSLSAMSTVDLRSAFRKLLNAGQATVPSSLHHEQTPARWLASAPRAQLEQLIATQGLRTRVLGYSGEETEAEPVPAAATEPPKAELAKVQAPAQGDAGSALAALIAPHLSLGLDEAKMRALIKEQVAALLAGQEARVLEVRGPAATIKTDDARHQSLERLIRYVDQRQHVFLVGPAGTGKSHGAHQAATLLSLDFYSISVGMQSTQTDLFGYMNAHGTYVRTQFRDAYEKGGVFCLDEMDGGSPNVLNALNSALANGSVAFPDGRVTRHPNFVVVATGNTWGNGKTMEYIGRAALDGAFLSRFARLFWGVDEKLEGKLGPVPQWTQYVQQVRKTFQDRGIKAIVAPRISIAGGLMILAGQSVQDTIEDYLASGLAEDARKVLAGVKVPTVVLKQAQEAA